ncbi:MAG TPA: ABC transporter substrate-binding protein, partial [Stellaceae bacterium]|nr:ABC transporter substrate-binding protein [Stellaceae bacterium]
MRKFLIPCAALLVASFHPWAAALADGPVRVGVLKFGSVQWELDVMRRHQIDVGHGFTVETVELASKDAAPVALQGGAVDIILTDWLWVARRRVSGGDYTFVPHSRTNGGVMVAVASGIK